MRSSRKCTIGAPEVKALASELIQKHLKLADFSVKCTSSVVLSVLLFAAARVRSIYDACQRLQDVPGDETIRQALLASLPPQQALEARLNAALGDRLPKCFFRRGQRLAIDLTGIPYHGLPYQEGREICRSQPKAGTSHFHTYATAYVARQGHRYTLAMTYVFGDEKIQDVLKRLMQQVQKLGVKVEFLLLDKGFFNAEVVRYLQAARYGFLMPAFPRGRKPKQPKPDSLHAYAARKKSSWQTYSWRSQAGTKATVGIAIVCRYYRGQRGRHGRRTQLYAYWRIQPRAAHWVYQTYRKRFGIETSYRQMNEVRIRTSTRKPLLRLLFVGLALILRNVWVWCHLNWLAQRRGVGIIVHDELLRLGEMMLWIQQLIEDQFQLCLAKPIPHNQLHKAQQAST